MLEIPFQSDPLPLYRNLEDLGGAVLLESHGSSPQARWDILAAAPSPQDSAVLPSSLSATETVSAVDTFRRRVARQLDKETDATSDLPFTGGFIGHLSYELGRRLQGLPPQRTRMPIAVLRHYPWAIVQDRRSERSWLVGEVPSRLGEQIKSWATLPAAGKSPLAERFRLTSAFQSAWSKAEFRERFERVREYVLSGDCYQINIGQPFKAGFHGDPLGAYAALRKVANAPFSAYLPLGNGSALLSLSPERFLQITGDTVETRPIKGTRPRSPNRDLDEEQARALLHSPKERAENLMIVDLLRNDLGRHCETGSIRVDELYRLESYATVHHLTSVIRGTLRRGTSPLDLFLGCLPGGSITGAPKRRAMELIDELEPEPRQSWCGNVFYLSNSGRMDSSIAIRTLYADEQTLTCWAGGGLVIDSEADAEYQEHLDKVGALLASLEGVGDLNLKLRKLEVAE